MQRNRLDAILYPTLALPPCRLDSYSEETNTYMVSHNNKSIDWKDRASSLTEMASALNLPAVTLPVFLPEVGENFAGPQIKWPVNMEVCGDTGNDRYVLAVASLIERELGIR
jgi:Asp-tRNA(Asn)/Glu-tRNA(Gln) amidotransferase A subunit family amidase